MTAKYASDAYSAQEFPCLQSGIKAHFPASEMNAYKARDESLQIPQDQRGGMKDDSQKTADADGPKPNTNWSYSDALKVRPLDRKSVSSNPGVTGSWWPWKRGRTMKCTALSPVSCANLETRNFFDIHVPPVQGIPIQGLDPATPLDSSARTASSVSIARVSAWEANIPDSPRRHGQRRAPARLPDEISPPIPHSGRRNCSTATLPSSPREKNKLVHPELAFAQKRRPISSPSPPNAEVVSPQASVHDQSDDFGSRRPNLISVNEEMRKLTPDIAGQQPGRLSSPVRSKKRGCKENKIAGTVRKEKDKDPAKERPRWSAHSKVQKEDHNRKLASLPPRVLKLGEFPARLFSSQRTVGSPCRPWKGAEAEVATGMDMQVDSAVGREEVGRTAHVLPDHDSLDSRPGGLKFSTSRNVSTSQNELDEKEPMTVMEIESMPHYLRDRCPRLGSDIKDEVAFPSESNHEFGKKLCSPVEISSVLDHQVKVDGRAHRPDCWDLFGQDCAKESLSPHLSKSATGMVVGNVCSFPPESPKSRLESFPSDHPKPSGTQMIHPHVKMPRLASGNEDLPVLSTRPSFPSSKRPTETKIDKIKLLVRSMKFGNKISCSHAQKELDVWNSRETQRMNSSIATKWRTKGLSKAAQSSASSESSRRPRGSARTITGEQALHSQKTNHDDEILKEIDRLQRLLRSQKMHNQPAESERPLSREQFQSVNADDPIKEAGSKPAQMEWKHHKDPPPVENVYTLEPSVSPSPVTSVLESRPSSREIEITCLQRWRRFVTGRKKRTVSSLKSASSARSGSCARPICTGRHSRSRSSLTGSCPTGDRWDAEDIPSRQPSKPSSPPSGPFWPFREGGPASDGRVRIPERLSQPQPLSRQSEEALRLAQADMHGIIETTQQRQTTITEGPFSEDEHMTGTETISTDAFDINEQPVCLKTQKFGAAWIHNHTKPQSEFHIDESLKQSQPSRKETCGLLDNVAGNGPRSQSAIGTLVGAPLSASDEHIRLARSMMIHIASLHQKSHDGLIDPGIDQDSAIGADRALLSVDTATIDSTNGDAAWDIGRASFGTLSSLEETSKDARETREKEERAIASRDAKPDAHGDSAAASTPASTKLGAEEVATEEIAVSQELKPPHSSYLEEPKKELQTKPQFCDTRTPNPKSSNTCSGNSKQERESSRIKIPASLKRRARKTTKLTSRADVGTNVVFRSCEDGPVLSEKGPIVRTEAFGSTRRSCQSELIEKAGPRWRP